MPANFSTEDNHWKINILPRGGDLNVQEKLLVVTTFESETVKDVENIKRNMIVAKIVRKLCLYKLLTCVPEQLFTLLFLGRKRAKMHREMTALHYKLVLGKISIAAFQKSLLSASKNSIIV